MWQDSNIPFDRARRVYVSINRQPSWVTKAALFAGATMMLLIVLLLVVPAIVVGLLVFGVLALFYRLKAAVTGAIPRDDGRRNVTVVRRDPPGGF
jgi:hypothetical protein